MKKTELRFRKMVPGAWLWLLCMAAGGGVSVYVSKVWDRPFYVDVSFGDGTAGESRDVPGLVSMLGDDFLEENGGHDGYSAKIQPRIADTDGESGGEDLSSRREDADLSQRLNFAYYYDEGSASQGVSQSYAGRVYQMLLQKDSAWMAGLYDLRRVSPETMAARLGMDKNAVMGVRHLNGVPVDSKEKAQAIPSWNRFNVTFRNGDGTIVMGHSNIKEILSVANVCGYFMGEQSYDFLSSYAGTLWNASHSSRISVSNVYYCQGECLYSGEDSGLNPEAAQAEGGGVFEGTTGNRNGEGEVSGQAGIHGGGAGGSAADDGSQETEPAVHETVEIFRRQNDYEPADETILKMREAAKASAATEEGAQADVSSSENSESADKSGESVQESSSQPAFQETEASPENTGESRAEGEHTADGADSGLQPGTGEDTASQTGNTAEAAATQTDGGAGAEAPAGSTAGETPVQSDNTTEEAAASAGAETGKAAAPASSVQGEMGAGGETAAPSNRAAEGAKASSRSRQYCMGHIDLNITAVVMGIDDKKGLFHCADVPAGTEDGADWNGWDDESMNCARTVAQQDWYEQYSLASPESAYVQNPLSGSEIASYMAFVEDTSPKRRQVVEQALLSVGCIPYYWGGKPSRGGYEGNGFGTVVSPDADGRMLRGLDCSGWINWVYWTALGTPLSAQSTSGLTTCGRGVGKADLRAGDILIRTGSQPHVYMFLAWARDGSMYLIHETTGNVNNVTVGTYDLDLSCYRSLINEE